MMKKSFVALLAICIVGSNTGLPVQASATETNVIEEMESSVSSKIREENTEVTEVFFDFPPSPLISDVDKYNINML